MALQPGPVTAATGPTDGPLTFDLSASSLSPATAAEDTTLPPLADDSSTPVDSYNLTSPTPAADNLTTDYNPTTVEPLLDNLTTVEPLLDNLTTVEPLLDNLTTVEPFLDNLTTTELFLDNLTTTELLDNVTSVDDNVTTPAAMMTSEMAPDNVTETNATFDICLDLEFSIPSAEDYLNNLYDYDLAWLIATILAGACTVVIVCIWIEQMCFLQRHYGGWKLKPRVTWILGLYPVIALLYTIGIFIPRTAAINDMIAAIYLAIVLHQFCQMIVEFHGGNDEMALRLGGTRLPISSPPFCCCPCAPRPLVTRRNIRVFEILVLQYAVVRPLLAFVLVMFALNTGPVFGSLDREQISEVMDVFDIVSTVCTLLSIYGMSVIYRTTLHAMSDFHIRPKFLVMKLVLILTNIQGAIINALLRYDVLTCEPPLNALATARRLQMALLIFELLIISVLARRVYRRKIEVLQLASADFGAQGSEESEHKSDWTGEKSVQPTISQPTKNGAMTGCDNDAYHHHHHTDDDLPPSVISTIL